MEAGRTTLSLPRLQWLIWSILFAVHVLSLLPYDPFWQAFLYTIINIGAYMLVIYGNAILLLPRLWERNRKTLYVSCTLLFLAVAAAMRYCSSFYIYNRFFAKGQPTPFKWSSTISSVITVLLVYMSSILFYIALGFFRLKSKQEQLQKRHAEAELNLLKAQVQPHFLFNTLNNIYFVAQRESPATAALLEQLSLIMRYFVDEAPRERIALSSEIHFIRSYLDLEKMRMRFPLRVTLHEEAPARQVIVPPMLLIPLVENVCKHGIDKLRSDNFIDMAITINEERLDVTVRNRVAGGTAEQKGTGLHNLRSRLALLYADDYVLQTATADEIFTAHLNIPL